MPLLDQLQSTLIQRHAKGMLRNLTIHEPSTLSSSSTLADFSSNDYLSIATSSELKQHFMRRAESGRVGGSTGSRLLDGNNGTGEMEALERRLCAFFKSDESALLCPSGWEANVSLFSTLPQKDDVVLYDSLVHASVHDGLRRCRAKCIPFKHNDIVDFESQLQDVVASIPQHANVFLSIEALYSMDGDYAPLPAFLAVARRLFSNGLQNGRFWTIIDEAHSGGCFGPNGAGMTAEWGLHTSQHIVRVMTFGKGLGASGAVVLCPSIVRHYLINYARPLIFSTAIAHSALLLIHAALDVLESPSGQDRRKRLYANCQLLKDELMASLSSTSSSSYHEVEGGIMAIRDVHDQHSPLINRAVCNAASVSAHDVDENTPQVSPIMPLLTPHHYTRPLALYLQQRGYLVRPITYPTVPMGKDRVRICVHSDNTPHEIKGFARAVADWVETVASAGSGTAASQGAALTAKSSRL